VAVASAEPYANLHLVQTGNHASTPPLSFYRLDAPPAIHATASKHWSKTPRNKMYECCLQKITSV